MQIKLPEPGLYRHSGGNLYQVLFVAMHTETEEWMVVYQALYGQRQLWVRPASMWFDQVGVDEAGQPITRFTRCE